MQTAPAAAAPVLVSTGQRLEIQQFCNFDEKCNVDFVKISQLDGCIKI